MCLTFFRRVPLFPGFKFGALIGQLMADLAMHGTTDRADLGPFSLARFGDRVQQRAPAQRPRL